MRSTACSRPTRPSAASPASIARNCSGACPCCCSAAPRRTASPARPRPCDRAWPTTACGAARSSTSARTARSARCELTVSAVRGHDGAVRSHVVAVSDITQSRQQQERLERQAHFDELTGLPNRVKLASLLHAALETSQREGSLLTVCHLDIDHFKAINELHGHDAGNALLVKLSERIQASLRSWAGGDDVAARVGGDEFALLLRTATLRESHHAVERVLQQIAVPCDVGLAGGPLVGDRQHRRHRLPLRPRRRRGPAAPRRPGDVRRQAGRPQRLPVLRRRAGPPHQGPLRRPRPRAGGARRVGVQPALPAQGRHAATAACSAPKRCCAGTTRSTASCRRGSSCR